MNLKAFLKGLENTIDESLLALSRNQTLEMSKRQEENLIDLRNFYHKTLRNPWKDRGWLVHLTEGIQSLQLEKVSTTAENNLGKRELSSYALLSPSYWAGK